MAAGRRHRPRYHAAHRLCHGGAVITTWLLVLLVSGYSSLASIVTVLLTPLFTYLLKPEYTLPVSLLSVSS